MELRQKTVSAALYRWLFELAERQGYDRRALGRAIGIDETVIDAADGRVSGDRHVRFLKLAENWPLADEVFQPDIEMRLWPFPDLAGVVCNSGTLREALRHFVKYRDLIGNVDWILMQETSDRMFCAGCFVSYLLLSDEYVVFFPVFWRRVAGGGPGERKSWGAGLWIT